MTVVPATATADDVLRHKPDGVFLSNGPGDPAATGEYAVPMIRSCSTPDMPIFGICLGHQMLASALGGQHGKDGARPSRRQPSGEGPARPARWRSPARTTASCVVPESLPEDVEVTHVSLFDGCDEGFRLKDRPVFSVQYHPEASPGPQDSHYLFQRFVELMEARKMISAMCGTVWPDS